MPSVPAPGQAGRATHVAQASLFWLCIIGGVGDRMTGGRNVLTRPGDGIAGAKNQARRGSGEND